MERWSTEQLQYSCRVLVVFIFASASLEKFQLVSCPDQKVLSPVKVYSVKYYITSNVSFKVAIPYYAAHPISALGPNPEV